MKRVEYVTRSTDPTGSLQSNRVSVPVNHSHLKLEDTLEESLPDFNVFTSNTITTQGYCLNRVSDISSGT